MGEKSGAVDKWREYFGTANSDIFDIIEHAIIVAASDCPKEFRLRRDRIAETLFSCKLTHCLGCDRVELVVPLNDEDDKACKAEFDAGGSKESKVNSNIDEHENKMNMNMNMNMNINTNHVSNYSFGEAEALTDEIEEETRIVGEVLRIKEIVNNSQDESNTVILDSLRRLQLMALSVETLKGTEIGKAVNPLRKHASKEIRLLARTLIEGWMAMVDEWVAAATTIAGGEGGTPESLNPSVLDEEEGLPSPPMDDLAFFATQTTSMELGQFFDGMDDDGNPRNSGEFNKNRENGRKPSVETRNVPKQKQQLLPIESVNPPNIKKDEQIKKQQTTVKKTGTGTGTVARPSKPSVPESGPGRPTKPSLEQKVHSETKFQQKSGKITTQRRPLGFQDKSRCSDETAIQAKLEATKRKLQERYRQAENAKRQRTIQVMELHDLPKQSLGHKNPHARPGNNKHWTNGRR